MRKLLFAAAFAVSLSGCAAIGTLLPAPISVSITTDEFKALYAAKAAYNVAATAYVSAMNNHILASQRAIAKPLILKANAAIKLADAALAANDASNLTMQVNLAFSLATQASALLH